MATKRQKVIFEFAHLSQFLEEQQSVLLAELEKLDGDILKQRDVFDALVSEEICRFSTLVAELEEKLGRPARELLTVSPARPARPSSTVTVPAAPSTHVSLPPGRSPSHAVPGLWLSIPPSIKQGGHRPYQPLRVWGGSKGKIQYKVAL